MTGEPTRSSARQSESLRHRVFVILEGGVAAGWPGFAVELFLIVLIIANVVAYALESVPWFRHSYNDLLIPFEVASVVAFTVEYVLRLWTSVEEPAVSERGGLRGRWDFATRPMMVIDFFAIAPAIVQFFVPFFDLRFLRLIRMFRLLKIARYSPALSTLGHVIREERRALFGTLLLLLCAMTFAAAAMHAAEGNIQPQKFGTIPDAMYWAITTLTTVGYGDETPVTALGRVIAGLTMITGLGLFALPVGIVATGYVSTIHRRDFVVTFGMLARVPLFRDFDAQTIGEILDHLRSHAVGPGAILSARGERAETMYFIVSGTVDIALPGGNLHFGNGDFFGELALLHETMRAANVVATASTRYLVLTASDFETLILHHPELKGRVLRNAATQVENLAVAGGVSESEIAAARKAHAEAA